jgi:uncharacterized protein YidB (DUF937 family)
MLGGLMGGGGGSNNILASVLKVVGSQSGGLEGLLSKLTGGGGASKGLVDKAQTWIGTGPNAPISGDEAEEAVGTQTVEQVAQDAGVSTDEAKHGIAAALPQLVDRISPNGSLPDVSSLQGALGKLLGHQ